MCLRSSVLSGRLRLYALVSLAVYIASVMQLIKLVSRSHFAPLAILLLLGASLGCKGRKDQPNARPFVGLPYTGSEIPAEDSALSLGMGYDSLSTEHRAMCVEEPQKNLPKPIPGPGPGAASLRVRHSQKPANWQLNSRLMAARRLVLAFIAAAVPRAILRPRMFPDMQNNRW